MRVANLCGRAVLIVDGAAIDVENASVGEFISDPASLDERWDEFYSWSQTATLDGGDCFDSAELSSPSPTSRQVFAIVLNYREHAEKSGYSVPSGSRRCSLSWPRASPRPVPTSNSPPRATPTEK